MTDLTPRQDRTLALGIAAFDAAARRRRIRRGALRTAAFAAVATACVVALRQPAAPAAPSLPAYVEIIEDDRQLAAELALARACERIERSAGRLLVVECSAQGPAH